MSKTAINEKKLSRIFPLKEFKSFKYRIFITGFENAIFYKVPGRNGFINLLLFFDWRFYLFFLQLFVN